MIKFNISNKNKVENKSVFEEEEDNAASNTKLEKLKLDEEDDEAAEMAKVMGFGTFGRVEPVKNDDKAKPNKSKAAKSFDIDEMMKVHQDKVSAFVKPTNSEDDSSDDQDAMAGPSSSTLQEAEDDDDDLIGPPLPPGFLIDAQTKTKTDDDEEEEYDDPDDSDNDRYSVLPISQEIQLQHGTKTVKALTLDPNGARLVTGGIDHEVKFWDFQGMDSSLQSFRTIKPFHQHAINHLEFSSNGELILVVPAASIVKLLDRDGYVKGETTAGDGYLNDKNNTKGHSRKVNYGAWHPNSESRSIFATCSDDGTCRLWDAASSLKQHIGLIRPKNLKLVDRGIPLKPNILCFNKSKGDLIAIGYNEGSVQMWDTRSRFINVAHEIRAAHQVDRDCSIASMCYSWNESYFLSRGLADHTLKLWDLRMIRASKGVHTAGKSNFEPVHVKSDLFTRYENTDCLFSPDDRLVATAVGCDERASSEEVGKLIFYDVNTFEMVQEIEGSTRSSLIRAHWHPKLNQIVTSSSDGSVRMYFDEKRSDRGAKLCSFRQKRKRIDVFQVSKPQIITPHALPMFKEDRRKSNFVRMMKERKDPVKSKRPELPMDGAGQGGRLASAGKTFASFIARNLGVRNKIDDSVDPREALLKFAKDAEENPYWVAPAYQVTQPKAIFNDSQTIAEVNEQDDDEVDEQGQRKKRKHIPV